MTTTALMLQPIQALPKGDALDHLSRAAEFHIAAGAHAYRCERAGVDNQPFLTKYFPRW
jgi:hypothetical protein